MNRTRLKLLLVKHEGDKRHPYKDSKGHLTIGVGRNLEAKPLSDEVVALMLDEDIHEAHANCLTLAAFGSLDEVRQHVLLDMCFNLGLPRLLKFVKMLDAIERRDFEKAAAEMLDSEWARQVGERADRLAGMMRTGIA